MIGLYSLLALLCVIIDAIWGWCKRLLIMVVVLGPVDLTAGGRCGPYGCVVMSGTVSK